MHKIAVLGLGNFGTALARNWSMHDKNVQGWTVEQEVYDSIVARGVNEKYFAGFDLPGLAVTMSLRDVLEEAEVIALALPSHVVLSVVDDILPLLADEQILLDLAKGLAPGEKLVSEAIHEKLDAIGRLNAVAVMTGPTIAPELAAGVLTTALVACDDEDVAEYLAGALSTPTFAIGFATDPLGVELWGAFKNVIALACGMSDGLAKVGSLGGDNLKAAIFTAGFREGCRLLERLGAGRETALSPAGVGDLFVTATSPHGRNRRTGERLGMGEALDDALGATVMVSEGVRATRMFADRLGSPEEAPFVSTLRACLDGELGAEECVRRMIRIA
jgi:glycerol-3-phosphate dehydrogenase (NAD(P)+)